MCVSKAGILNGIERRDSIRVSRNVPGCTTVPEVYVPEAEVYVAGSGSLRGRKSVAGVGSYV